MKEIIPNAIAPLDSKVIPIAVNSGVSSAIGSYLC